MKLHERLAQAWARDDWLAQALRPLGALHASLLRLRVWLYAHGLKHSGDLPVPVIVVGNWIVGGAGKTPTTLAILQTLEQMGLRAGVVSRGYGRPDERDVHLLNAKSTASEAGDEPLLIHRRSQCPVAVGRDRIAAAHALLAAHPDLQILVSDDGLQHWRLPRALSITVFDERGLGNGRLLPAGPMRQIGPLPPPPGSSTRNLTLYSGGHVSTPWPGFLAHRRLAGAVALKAWWAGEPARLASLHALRDRQCLALAGLAQPERFFEMLRAEGLQIQTLALADHADLSTCPWPAGTQDVLLTEKDAVKLPPERAEGARVWVVALDFSPELAFEQALRHEVQSLLT